MCNLREMSVSRKHGFDLRLLLVFLIMLVYTDIQGVMSDINTNNGLQDPSDDYTYNYDYAPDFSPESSYCKGKTTCDVNSDLSFPDKNCYCDEFCSTMDDCCLGYKKGVSIPHAKSQFACIKLPEIVTTPTFGIYLVNKCAPDWKEIETKNKCEGDTSYDDLFLKLPVSDNGTGVMFKNMYCGYCNYVYDFSYWNPEVKCTNDTVVTTSSDTSECDMDFIKPYPSVKDARKCYLDIIEHCPTAENDEQIKYNCSYGPFSIMFVKTVIFRNTYCAQCHGASPDEIVCYPDSVTNSTSTRPPDRKKTYSFRLLVDFNSGEANRNQTLIDIRQKCGDNEMYDPISVTCREILCIQPRVAKRGKCVLLTSKEEVSENCTLAKFTSTEYKFLNETEVFIFSLNRVYTKENFRISGLDVFICLERNQTCLHDCDSTAAGMFAFSEVESYISLAGLIVSITALAITFGVYISFPELLNTPGKILISLVVSLFLAQLLFLISSEVQSVPRLCQSIGILVHYFFLAAFCWMNIIALDLWTTFSKQFISAGSNSKSSKRWYMYNAYGWIVPLAIVSVAVTMDNVRLDDKYSTLKPGYGNGACWITSRDGLLLYFAGPLAIFKLFDIVSFIFTAVHIFKANRQGAMARQKNNACSFLINVKLSLVMGLTWVFAFVANIANISALWYLFIIFNSLQGLSICLSFLCTKKVTRLLREKYEDISRSRASSDGTQLTSLSRS